MAKTKSKDTILGMDRDMFAGWVLVVVCLIMMYIGFITFIPPAGH